jgi:hypothetical protein
MIKIVISQFLSEKFPAPTASLHFFMAVVCAFLRLILFL